MPDAALERFVQAQARDYDRALAELNAGRKTTHWIWYVLPQLRELGRSAMAREYGIAGRDEAAAYLAHPVLGPRLVAGVQAVLRHAGRSAVSILGEVDALKFRSCLTLFNEVAPGEPAFRAALQAFYDGQPDAETLRLLDAADPFSFAPVTEADLPMLREWLLRPHVAEWWGEAESIDELREDFVAHAHEDRATQAFIAAHERRPIGFIQCYFVMGSGDGWWEDETDASARGIDQFLADASSLGQGLGRAMIRRFVDRLFARSDASFVQTDPSPENARAIRCYRGAGFEAVGEVATPDGAALLMKRRRAA